MTTTERVVHTDDIAVRNSTIPAMREIAAEFDRLRMDLYREFGHPDSESKNVAFQYVNGEMDAETYERKRAEAQESLNAKAARLLHGLATIFEVSIGGTVFRDGPASLLGSGYMTVGLINHDHGKTNSEWSTHS